MEETDMDMETKTVNMKELMKNAALIAAALAVVAALLGAASL